VVTWVLAELVAQLERIDGSREIMLGVADMQLISLIEQRLYIASSAHR
jgi:hypothetical protein